MKKVIMVGCLCLGIAGCGGGMFVEASTASDYSLSCAQIQHEINAMQADIRRMDTVPGVLGTGNNLWSPSIKKNRRARLAVLYQLRKSKSCVAE